MHKYTTIITDADGTLADTREPISPEMAQVISQILHDGYTLAVISGATFTRLVQRICDKLPADTPLDRLYLLPASGSLMYAYQDGDWQEIYSYTLSAEEKSQIHRAFDIVLSKNLVDIPDQVWGERLEDREASFAFSALGQDAPREEKDQWDADQTKRRTLIAALQPLLPEYHLLIGGSTTIDINKKEHGKDFGVDQFLSHAGVNVDEAYFIGDQLSPGGNDHPVTTLGIDNYHTTGPEDTLKQLQTLIPTQSAAKHTPDKKYDIFICDLDDTLAESKSPISSSMAQAIAGLIQAGKTFVVITGGMEKQIISQVVEQLPPSISFESLYLLPTSGSRMMQYSKGEWQMVYTHDFTPEEKDHIDTVVQKVLDMQLVDIPHKTWGPIMEDRSSQISYSMLGQKAPIEAKSKWDVDKSKRKLLIEHIAHRLPQFHVSYGGTTTIDITKQGIDKGFGIEQFFAHTNLDIDRALFIGDAMTPEGNDYPAIRTGIDTYTTTDPSDTEEVLRGQF